MTTRLNRIRGAQVPVPNMTAFAPYPYHADIDMSFVRKCPYSWSPCYGTCHNLGLVLALHDGVTKPGAKRRLKITLGPDVIL